MFQFSKSYASASQHAFRHVAMHFGRTVPSEAPLLKGLLISFRGNAKFNTPVMACRCHHVLGATPYENPMEFSRIPLNLWHFGCVM